jgi:PAS domain S-box-containing protein
VTGRVVHPDPIDLELLASVLDLTSDGILVADRAGTILYVNAPLLAMFGYDREKELLGQPVESLIPAEARRSHRSSVKAFANDPRPRPMGRADLDIEGQRRDRTRFSVDVQLNPLAGADLVVATVRDVTEQRHLTADRALRSIELDRARAQNDRLRLGLDLMVQRLFGIGIAMNTAAPDAEALSKRIHDAVTGIDAIIEEVQRIRQADGPGPAGTSGT